MGIFTTSSFFTLLDSKLIELSSYCANIYISLNYQIDRINHTFQPIKINVAINNLIFKKS